MNGGVTDSPGSVIIRRSRRRGGGVNGGGYGGVVNGGGYGGVELPGGVGVSGGGVGITPSGPNPGDPRVPVRGADDWRSHLELAIEALQSAKQATRSPQDMSAPLAYLNTALLQLQWLPGGIWKGHLAGANHEIKDAIGLLSQNPPAHGAAKLMNQALSNLEACKQMNL